MNLAIRLYNNMPSDDENILAGISGKIPAEVRFGVDTPPDDKFIIMSEQEYCNYMQSIQSELQIWKQIQETQQIYN